MRVSWSCATRVRQVQHLLVGQVLENQLLVVVVDVSEPQGQGRDDNGRAGGQTVRPGRPERPGPRRPAAQPRPRHGLSCGDLPGRVLFGRVRCDDSTVRDGVATRPWTDDDLWALDRGFRLGSDLLSAGAVAAAAVRAITGAPVTETP
ncbi:hypothetical protein CD790_18515 [Streptomyces sp. SAJ15]|nr:hypothetical protein CD790_18515 [Streptomyces sp. SAJ15]